jgi:hypothetical protein
LLTFHWLLTGGALIVAAMTLVKARRLSKRLDRLTESYWELRYEHGQLRTRVARLDPEQTPALDEAPRQAGSTAFVPLSSLRR